MKAIVCEMCGSNDVVKQDGFYVCQHCNTKYSVEEAKKLMVTVDNSSKVENLFTVAKNAHSDGNYKQAAKYYDLVLQENPNIWEAAFYSIYDEAIECKIKDIDSAAYSILNAVPRTLELIKNNTYDQVDDERKPLLIKVNLLQIATDMQLAAQVFYDAASKHYREFSNIDGAYKEKHDRMTAIMTMLLGTGDQIQKVFGKEDYWQTSACKLWECGLSIYTNGAILKPSFYEDYVQKIRQIKPDYSPATVTSTNSGGCYIATAVYGSYDCPPVWTLRRFRDFTLAKTWYGRAFVKTYYAISPTLVRWFGNTEWFRKFWEKNLNKMVAQLQEMGYESSPYND